MKKLSIVCLAVVMAVVFGYGSALADPSAKATVQAGYLGMIESASFADILTQTIHVASQKDLVIDVSLECGLTTNTKVISKKLATALAEAEAIVKIRVLVDPLYDSEGNLTNLEAALAAPGEVTFARRAQTMIAEFAGDISGALRIVEGAIVIDEDLIEPETLQLILDTMSANSFNFIATDLTAGTHTVVVQADRIMVSNIDLSDDELAEAEAAATAYIGKGSVSIEEVRMVKGEDVDI